MGSSLFSPVSGNISPPFSVRYQREHRKWLRFAKKHPIYAATETPAPEKVATVEIEPRAEQPAPRAAVVLSGAAAEMPDAHAATNVPGGWAVSGADVTTSAAKAKPAVPTATKSSARDETLTSAAQVKPTETVTAQPSPRGDTRLLVALVFGLALAFFTLTGAILATPVFVLGRMIMATLVARAQEVAALPRVQQVVGAITGADVYKSFRREADKCDRDSCGAFLGRFCAEAKRCALRLLVAYAMLLCLLSWKYGPGLCEVIRAGLNLVGVDVHEAVIWGIINEDVLVIWLLGPLCVRYYVGAVLGAVWWLVGEQVGDILEGRFIDH
ncbi:hypothetical protein OQA88_7112 [Cercophora sp. LCS_1]